MEANIAAADTFNVESMLTAPPTDKVVFKDVSFSTANVEPSTVALDTSNVDLRTVPSST